VTHAWARGPAAGGALLSLMAAAAFGVMTPAAKGSLSHLTPLRAAGLAYLAAAAACLAALAVRRLAGGSSAGRGRRVRGKDLVRLGAMILAGGIAGPWLFFEGLQRLQAHQVAVLQNLEFALTVLAALLMLGERPGRAGAAGLAMVAAGLGAMAVSGNLAATPGRLPLDLAGAGLVAAACAAWAADNTLARGASDLDPLVVVLVKGAGAGLVLTGLSRSDPFPAGAGPWAAVLIAGGVGIGLSLVLELAALRRIGAALNAGLFATGPAFGFLLSMIFLAERPAVGGLLAVTLCAGGAVALAFDSHRHAHIHEHLPLPHSHPHVHDAHHRHRH
jgi:drug/metabolite transporter (DMT)-like permease